MYATQLNGQKLTLGVSGKLWRRSLVMYDRETESSWSHILGEAMDGRLKGTKLEQVPSVITDWQSWRKTHPQGTVVMLPRTAQQFTTEFYRRPEMFVLGIASGVRAKAWTFPTLKRKPVIHDRWLDQPMVLMFDAPSATPRMYRRNLDGRQLTFRVERPKGGRHNVFKDEETGSTWDPVAGVATAGDLRGKHLEPLPAIVSFRHAWQVFHAESKVE